MNDVTRWKNDIMGHMVTELDGEYVSYADYAAAEAELQQAREALVVVSNVLRATRDFTTNHRPGCDKLTAMNCACGFDLYVAVYQHALAQAETALAEE